MLEHPPAETGPETTAPTTAPPQEALPPARVSDLWTTRGLVSQRAYLGWGVGLTAFKYNLDRFVARYFFSRAWTPLDYALPGSALLDGLAKSGVPKDVIAQNIDFGLFMLAFALPFMWTGIAMTTRRLRTLELPLATIGLFMVPGVNLLFFATLGLLPDPQPRQEDALDGELASPDGAALKSRSAEAGGGESTPGFLDRFMPVTTLGSAVAACSLAIPPVILLTLVSVFLFSSYGFALFLGLPFWLGLSATMLHGYREPRGFVSSLAVGAMANALCGAALLALAIEGAVCLLMASPLAFALGGVGSTLGYFLQRDPGRPTPITPLLPLMLALMPALMGMEYLSPPAIPTYRVDTSLDVNAPPAEVWKHVLAFPQLDPPTDWIFKTGIAYPLHAEIKGEGVGAVRHCVFSTGAFVEPIEVWDPPRRLAFSVTETPHPMTEWTPYPGAPPPHLEEFMISKGGEFRLVELPGGRTRLEGTTWYQHHMWPGSYWHGWASWIMHRIHLRVLRHIRVRAEIGAGRTAQG